MRYKIITPILKMLAKVICEALEIYDALVIAIKGERDQRLEEVINGNRGSYGEPAWIIEPGIFDELE